MTRLILVRHGETDWNRARRIQGSTDIPLNDTGRAQARDTALRLRDEVDPETVRLVSSDLSRARETAEIIGAELGLDGPRTYPELRERGYGDAEGETDVVFAERWGPWPTAQVPNAESREDVRARALRGLTRVVSDARSESAPGESTVIVVAHGALIREVIGHASEDAFPIPGERLANGSVHHLRWEGDRIRLLSYAAG
ncbi:histidine phosphatase family protein [Microbacterium sp. cx-59]|uniref:histidine phosphatase family protein n=1 Tax=Microbacterium sp. cx-59 TaxID=2891207 RepID=UPI001E404CDA|nr:histidine phosphatase family protein [Microbacterium sp. cx-59]MCC4907444.1 histidine phosphatase family protein [Microbacterium sp. cx-59]